MKKTRLMTLLLALAMVLAMSQMAMAEPYTAEGGTYTFDGTKIVASQKTSVSEQLKDLLEPGDSVTMTLTYVNKDSVTTEWYLENTVIQTLETATNMRGGYTYRLTNVGPDGAETTIFDSDAVGGGENGAGKGLDQATTATEGKYESQDYFFIQTLEPGQQGLTKLYVELDGESQINTYQEKEGEIEFSYAVERAGEEDIIKHVKKKRYVDTGDRNRLMLAGAMFIGSLTLLIIALLKRRREGKDGEEA